MVFRDADWINAGFTPDTARRFYTFTDDSRQKAYLTLINEEVLPPYPERHGRFSAGIAGHPGIGLCPVSGMPHLIMPTKFKTNLDFYRGADGWVVSNRARQLFDDLDEGAFEFDEVKVTHGPNGPMELAPYWRMDVVRVLDCIDDEQSVIDGTPSLSNPKVLWYIRLIDVKVKLHIVNDAHAFRVRQGFGPILDSVIVDEIRARRYRGLSFTPLQTPTLAETGGGNIGQNSEYWREKSPIKDYWDARIAESDRRYHAKLAREAK